MYCHLLLGVDELGGICFEVSGNKIMTTAFYTCFIICKGSESIDYCWTPLW